ncbi:hypothetical protein [Pigmentiphaga soli]|uniref:hypothetical protein n=1 Tax=Pigmentiphaga soli TaxID=1007095 RepID=UPI0031E88D18
MNAIDERLSRIEVDVGLLKNDVGALKSDVGSLKSDVGSIRATLAGLDAKMDIASIRSAMEKGHTDIYKWIASIVISVIGLGSAIYFGQQRAAVPPNTAAAVQPSPSPVVPASRP